MTEKLQDDDILSEAIAWRAQAFRRWRRAADGEVTADKRRIYEALAAFECDRYDRLVQRFLYRPAPHPRTAETAGRPTPSLHLPRGTRGRAALRAARVAAEAERRTWAEVLRRTSTQEPQRALIAELVEDARRTRDDLGAR